MAEAQAAEEAVDTTAEEMPPEPSDQLAPAAEMVPAQAAAATLFRTEDPEEVLARAGAAATALSGALERQGMTTQIQGRPHVNVEGWQTCGSMLGVYPVKEWVRPIPWPDPIPKALERFHERGLSFGFEASYRACTRDGAVVGSGEAECRRTEGTWKDRDDTVLKGMAQTRATSRALKSPLGFVVTMAGYSATPAEEMPANGEAAPEWGPRASAAGVQAARKAVDILGAGKALERVTEWAGYQPKAAVQALIYAADEHRKAAATTGEQDQAAEAPDDAPPDTTEPTQSDPPGSMAPSPLNIEHHCTCTHDDESGEVVQDDACPIEGHGIPF